MWAYIKEYISTWKNVLQVELSELKWNNAILDVLKEADKKYLHLEINFSTKQIIDFKGLLAVRNAYVHSSGNIDHVEKYIPLIKQLTKAFPSIELSSDGVLWTTEQFCKDAMLIGRRFFFYITKLAIRKYPEYRLHKPMDEDFWKTRDYYLTEKVFRYAI